MAACNNYNILVLPDLIFTEIMLMMVCDSLENLHRCRQVCKTWNEKIMKNIWENPGKVKIIQAWIEEKWKWISKIPSNEEISHVKWLGKFIYSSFLNSLLNYSFSFLESKGIFNTEVIESLTKYVRTHSCNDTVPKITCAASLAYHGLIGLDSVEFISFCDENLSSVPTSHLAALASCVLLEVSIRNVSGCNLVSFLNSIDGCHILIMSEQSLCVEDSQALVNAMGHVERMQLGVDMVTLGKGVILDINTFTKYNGQGECRMVEFQADTATRYGADLRDWARRINWDVTLENDNIIVERSESSSSDPSLSLSSSSSLSSSP